MRTPKLIASDIDGTMLVNWAPCFSPQMLGLVERIVDAGAHVLAIKDMAGLLRAPAARTLVTALRERFDLPVIAVTAPVRSTRRRLQFLNRRSP